MRLAITKTHLWAIGARSGQPGSNLAAGSPLVGADHDPLNCSFCFRRFHQSRPWLEDNILLVANNSPSEYHPILVFEQRAARPALDQSGDCSGEHRPCLYGGGVEGAPVGPLVAVGKHKTCPYETKKE